MLSSKSTLKLFQGAEPDVPRASKSDEDGVIGILSAKNTKGGGRTRYSCSPLPKYVFMYVNFCEVFGKSSYDAKDCEYIRKQIRMLRREHPAAYDYYVELDLQGWKNITEELDAAALKKFNL